MPELASLLPIIAIALVFWLLLIRPASRRQKAQASMQSALSVGDQVMLTSGIFATVISFGEEDRLHVAIASGVTVEVVRGAVAKIVTPTAIDERNDGAEDDVRSDEE